MPAIQDTAYPRFRSDISVEELAVAYTPTAVERRWADKRVKHPRQRYYLLLHLKVYQKLGYVIPTDQIPESLCELVAEAVSLNKSPSKRQVKAFDGSSTRRRHAVWIRDYRGTRLLADSDRQWLSIIAVKAAESKDILADIINILLEELVRHRFELPPFAVLVKTARSARKQLNDRCFQSIGAELTPEGQSQIDELLASTPAVLSGWQRLKREPRKPTNKEVRGYLQHLKWLKGLALALPGTQSVPDTKRRQFTHEARALNLAQMRRLPRQKRYALAVIFIRAQYAQALDDTAELLVRMMQQVENSAQLHLREYQLAHQDRADRLVGELKAVLQVLETEPGSVDAIRAALSDEHQHLLVACDEHLAYAGNNYLPFMLRPFRAKRSLLYNCLSILELHSTSNDTVSVLLLQFLQRQRRVKEATINLAAEAPDLAQQLVDAKWPPEKWRRLVFVDSKLSVVDRKYFELAVFTLVKQELRSGDLAVRHSERYDDYREQLVDQDTFEEELPQYGQEVELPVESQLLCRHLKEQLTQISRSVDSAFPGNSEVAFVDGRLSIKRANAMELPADWQALDDQITRRLGKTSILDVLVDTERWLELHKGFGPLSGHQQRLDDAQMRFIATVFCYGCNLGPSQTADSIKQLNRRQVAWLNLSHVTADRLDRAIVKVINAYKKYELPAYWGTGRHAAADGTKWNLYEQNLLSEYHLRYGGYGGIGYYHVSDTYIALFSHFIPCGVHEAVYILDGLLKNQSDIQPDTVHGDTQAQSYPVFALAYLLGIKLMPRIRNIKDLRFFRPDRRFRYDHIEPLFSGHIDWKLIERHVPDMLRVAVSIKLGRISASTILRRLGTYSRKNKLYFAFKELGKVVRTMFLLEYINDGKMRRTIHSATNKNEQFNGFTKWCSFGGEGVISANLQHEQQKVVKYNHLVANLLILHNVASMTRVLWEMADEGLPITEEVLKTLSPYRTSHINRFGDYTLNLSRQVIQPRYNLDFDFKNSGLGDF